jgi:signal transduction histidine kinase
MARAFARQSAGDGPPIRRRSAKDALNQSFCRFQHSAERIRPDTTAAMFRLLRYFSATSAAALVAVIAVLVMLYRGNAIGDLHEAAEFQNLVLARGLINSLWAPYAEFVRGAKGMGTATLRESRQLDSLRERVAELTAGMPVLKVKIYDASGLTVFSTDATQIGADYSGSEGLRDLHRTGKPVSEFSRRQDISAFSGEAFHRDIVETYVPVHNITNGIDGVFEIYSDITPLVQRIDRAAQRLGGGLIVSFALLYAALYSIVRHADRILRRQYLDLLESQEAIRKQNANLEGEILARRKTEDELRLARDELEVRVNERTADLAASNRRLQDENSERRAAETALLEAKSETERAYATKSNFLALASHDLRQPIQALVLYTAVLLHRIADPELRRVVSTMDEILKTVSDLLRSLLDLARLEANVVVAKPEGFAIHDLLLRVAKEHFPIARQNGLELRLVGSSLHVVSAPSLLESIVRNFVANAIAHTAKGRVLVGCRPRGGRARIEVWDTGPGIPEEKIGAIFREFVQLDGRRRDRGRGWGLGLAIVERTARLLGHPVTVSSRVGKGSMFAVEVPLAATTASPHQPPEPPVADLANVKAVIIDDEPSVVDSLATLLAAWGMIVIGVASPDEAVAELSRQGLRPDVIIADWQLGEGVTGLDAIRAVRDHCAVPIPALLITGDTAASTLQKAAESGMPLHHKPLEPTELRRRISELLGEMPPRK